MTGSSARLYLSGGGGGVFTFPETRPYATCFPFNRPLSGQRAAAWPVCQMITGRWAFGGRHSRPHSARFIVCSKKMHGRGGQRATCQSSSVEVKLLYR